MLLKTNTNFPFRSPYFVTLINNFCIGALAYVVTSVHHTIQSTAVYLHTRCAYALWNF